MDVEREKLNNLVVLHQQLYLTPSQLVSLRCALNFYSCHGELTSVARVCHHLLNNIFRFEDFDKI